MPQYFEHIRIEGVVLGLTEQTGAIVVYTKPNMRGETLKLETKDGYSATKDPKFGANVVERVVNGRKTYAAVFPRVPVENYNLYFWQRGDLKRATRDISVFANEVTEVDWR